MFLYCIKEWHYFQLNFLRTQLRKTRLSQIDVTAQSVTSWGFEKSDQKMSVIFASVFRPADFHFEIDFFFTCNEKKVTSFYFQPLKEINVNHWSKDDVIKFTSNQFQVENIKNKFINKMYHVQLCFDFFMSNYVRRIQ